MYTDKKDNSLGRPKHHIVLAVVACVLVVAGLSTSGYFYHKYQALRNNPNADAMKASNMLAAQVGKHLDLPKGETPTIATVEDKNKLKNEAFFASAQNGDKLLIYATAKKAIIYRPSGDRIINVGPIAVNSAPEGTSTNNTSASTGSTSNASSKKTN